MQMHVYFNIQNSKNNGTERKKIYGQCNPWGGNNDNCCFMPLYNFCFFVAMLDSRNSSLSILKSRYVI